MEWYFCEGTYSGRDELWLLRDDGGLILQESIQQTYTFTVRHFHVVHQRSNLQRFMSLKVIY